jgi:type I restriction enzyme R subunit/putative DNA methylase
MTQSNNKIKLFEEQHVRTVWDAENEKWWFSVVDIVSVLTEQADELRARKYWNKLKQRLREEGNETVTSCHQLKMLAKDGKMRLTDVADTEQILRLIQSIPSKKAEPFKMWLAQSGAGSAGLLPRKKECEAEAPRYRDGVCSGAEAPRSRGWYSRGYLPHCDEVDVLQFITFRLADSLPQEKLQQLEEELSALSEDERNRQRRIKIEQWLDAGMGCCALQHPSLAEVVENALFHSDGARYRLLAWVVMPNHVHVLIKPMASLPDIVRSWKGFTGHWAMENNAKLGLGILGKGLWMPDYWDRYIRSEEHYLNTIDYIHSNPVKAGLCASAEVWRWSSAASASLQEAESGNAGLLPRKEARQKPRVPGVECL